MNKLLILVALFGVTSLFAQGKVSFLDTIPSKMDCFKINLEESPTKNYVFNFKLIGSKPSQLSVYNSITKYNDIYFVQEDNYYNSNPKLVMENNWRSNKIDSLNPYGAPNLGSAIVFGVLDVLLESVLAK